MKKLWAAAAKVCITPEERTGLAGFDPTENIANPPEDILDDLFARILILDDGTRRTMIVSVDCLWVTEELIRHRDTRGVPGKYGESIEMFPLGTRNRWAEAAHADASCTLVVGTHTHSAPTHVKWEYVERITSKIREIENKLVPVHVSVGVGASAISAFRRPTLYPNLDVPIDQTLYTVFFETEAGQPLASLVNFAVHPTILHPSKVQLANRVSSECVGRAMNKLEEHLGSGFVSLFLQGFSGDVAPVLPGIGTAKDSYENVGKAGQELFTDILRTLNGKRSVSAAEIRVSSQSIRIPTRDGFYKNSLEGSMSALAFGSVALVCAPGEIFNGYVGKIRPKSPFEHTLLVSLTNCHLGYFPTQEAFQDGLGGYELGITPFDEQVDDILTSTALSLLQNLIHS